MRTESTAGNRAIIIALIAAAALPYLASIGFGYVLDDTTVIRSNATLSGWGSVFRVWAVPYGGLPDHYTGLYRPLTMTLFAIVWNLGGHWALWFHVVSIALHATATLLVLRVLAPAVERTPALVAAFWFATHPVHVEAVANVANVSEVLVVIWTCALALHVARMARSETIDWKQASVAGLLYLAAFLSKESGAVAAPIAMIWLWGWRRAPSTDAASRSHLLARWWRPLAAFAFAALTVFALRFVVLTHGTPAQSIAASGLEGSAAQRIWKMLSLGPKIAELLVWPMTTNPHYGPTAFPEQRALAATITLVLLSGLIAVAEVRRRKGDRRLLAATLWMLLAYLPASNLLVATGQVLSERTLYLASVGGAMLFAYVLDEIEAFAQRPGRQRIWYASFGLSVAVAAYFLGRTAIWTFVWRTNHSLFSQMIAADPKGYRGYWLQGLEARYTGDRDESLKLLERAYSLYPTDRGLLMDYSVALTEHGNATRARAIQAELAALDSARARSPK